MEHLTVHVDRPDEGWPLVVTIECGGYSSPPHTIMSSEEVGWRRAAAGQHLGAIIAAWITGGGLEALVEVRRRHALDSARQGRS